MDIQCNLLKLKTLDSEPVQYKLQSGSVDISVNDLIGRDMEINFLHEIHCIKCGRKTSKSFGQGYCFPCFQSAPETEECVLRPELCRAHEGQARDMEFAKTHCLIDHYVYLAYTSGVKVGVTRNTQIPTRWIDQGALQAVKLAKTPNRYVAGCIEVALKAHFNDRTNWRNMLALQKTDTDLQKTKAEAAGLLQEDYKKYIVGSSETFRFNYPVRTMPEKLNSVSLDKIPEIRGILAGIKGQYLIFEDGKVFNVRKHNGYLVRLKSGLRQAQPPED